MGPMHLQDKLICCQFAVPNEHVLPCLMVDLFKMQCKIPDIQAMKSLLQNSKLAEMSESIHSLQDSRKKYEHLLC